MQRARSNFLRCLGEFFSKSISWRKIGISLLLLITVTFQAPARDEWQPAKGPLTTRWAKDVRPEKTLPESPRPQMVRKDWLTLNGLWDYAITAKDTPQPTKWEGQILVPFPVESALSGVMKRVYETNQLWYRRTVTIPRGWKDKRVVLHFGAVDWEANVWVNGKELGSHQGGYDGFDLDVTDALKPTGDQEIVVSAFDPADTGYQPRGKQVRRPNGIWYTPTSGIWQTVWLEPVPANRIESLRITPNLDASEVAIQVNTVAFPGGEFVVKAEALDGKRTVQHSEIEAFHSKDGGFSRIALKIPKPKTWSPDNPFLYGLRITLFANGKRVDQVDSYFAMRKISVSKDTNGINRLCLNNQPLFQFGPLDQGFWPDGLYTAPSDEALRYDIEMTKKLGFNMARKHVKVEPERWYYWCDKLGLLVWQDMPSAFLTGRRGDSAPPHARESAEQFELELKRMIDGRYNHPCIVMWVPFNEGWGQHDTERITKWVKDYDPSRLVNNASGWTDHNVGDVHDIHDYPGPRAPRLEENRAAVLGEFGGLGMPVKDHTWQDERNWGYRSFTNADDLTTAYVGLLDKLHPLIGAHGLCAAVYTQTTDVEVEVNGLMTYDRALLKMNQRAISAAAKKLFTPPPPSPIVKTIIPTSEDEGHTWRYTTTQPEGDWFKPGFNDSDWREGPAGFGTRGTPGAHVRTEWNSPDIWLRRTCNVNVNPRGEVRLLLHHDEDAEVYLNGILASKVAGYVTEYEDQPINPGSRASLKTEGNTIAVHCHQTGGGQYIDVGLVEIESPKK